MPKPKLLSTTIKETEKSLALYKFISEKVPDIKMHFLGKDVIFSSKKVNSIYSNFEFKTMYHGVYVSPYIEYEFEYEGEKENVKIYSSPRSSRLIYLDYSPKDRNYIIKFSRLQINLKNNNFKDDMLSACRVEILNFVKNNPKYKIDQKHLEPRLKKLLLFT